MYKHFLLILEDYDKGQRIAFHKILCDQKDFETIKNYQKELEDLEIKFYTHLISTMDDSIKSVKQKDAFFKDFTFLNIFQSSKILQIPHIT
ncbi:integrase/recombinase [Staphylococcus caledonicus]|uniref:hypothetical protein n=1 Tax=Staphylococcus TaxID=1279 RepID=UPI001F567861|nr:hypothetical protein [Staphylococcus sp. acrmy]MCI2948093.1 hypothetical protein [Staphylococcus sp. acrmy]